MNANIGSTTRTHLIRGVFYTLLFVALYAMPIALGQRSATNSTIDLAKMSFAFADCHRNLDAKACINTKVSLHSTMATVALTYEN